MLKEIRDIKTKRQRSSETYASVTPAETQPLKRVPPPPTKDVERALDEDQPVLTISYPINYYDPNPIKDRLQRNAVRRMFLITVAVAMACYSVAILVAFELNKFNGVPSISLMLATQFWISPFLIVLQCIYMMTILCLALTSTSSTHVTNDPKELERIMEGKDPFACLNLTILILYMLYFPLFLLIHVIKVTEYRSLHCTVAISGIVVALLCHLFQWRRRSLIVKLFDRVHGPEAAPLGSIRMPDEYRTDGNSRMFAMFGKRQFLKLVLWANFLTVMFAILMGVLFVYSTWNGYEPESTTMSAIYEYVLYGTVIFLDIFRMLDVWCSIDVITIT